MQPRGLLGKQAPCESSDLFLSAAERPSRNEENETAPMAPALQIQPPLFLAREDAIELFPRNHPLTKILHRGVLVVLGALSSREMPRR
jgi:hypothetical protein